MGITNARMHVDEAMKRAQRAKVDADRISLLSFKWTKDKRAQELLLDIATALRRLADAYQRFAFYLDRRTEDGPRGVVRPRIPEDE